MIQIAKEGRVLLKWTTGAEAAFRVPDARASTAKLLEAADALILMVEPRLEVFYEDGGFRQGFLDEMRVVVDKLRAMAPGVQLSTQERGRVTQAIKEEIARGRQIVSSLDAALMPYIER